MSDKNMMIEWSNAQSCGDCGAPAAFLRHPIDGAAICRECSHEHPMDTDWMTERERYEWKRKSPRSAAYVLYVTCYTPLGASLLRGETA